MPPATPVNRPMTSFEWALLLVLALLWGGSFALNGLAVRELPTFTVVVVRVVIAALILLAAVKLSGGQLQRMREFWPMFLTMGLLNNAIPFSLVVWGQSQIASGLAAIIIATTPLFTVVVANSFTDDEKLTPERLVGVLLGIIGVAVMVGASALRSLDVDVLAQVACLGGALSYAVAGVYGRRFHVRGITPLEGAAGQITAASIVLLPIMLIVDRPWSLPMPSAGTIAALIAVAALSTALAYILYYKLLATAGATNLVLVTFLIPVTAILLGIVLLDETLQLKHVAGMLLIGCGLAAIDGRPWRKLAAMFARTPEKTLGRDAGND